MTCSVAGCGGQGDGGDMDGGEELRPWRGKGYGTRTEEREEGNGAEAHGGLGGLDGELGDALETAGQRWGSTAVGGEDGVGDGSTGRSGLCGSAESFRARGRNSCACRRGEGEAVATATVDGGDELRSAARERESRGGGKERERVRGYRGAWRLPGHPDEEGRGQAGREAGGVARRRARASGTRLAD